LRFPNRGTDAPVSDVRSKVPHVTLALGHQDPRDPPGETGGDALSMTLELGYATSTLIFLASRSPWSLRSRRAGTTRSGYWAVVVPTTTVGTTMSDYLDRTRGLGYVLSSLILLGGVLVTLFVWRRATGRIEFRPRSAEW